MISFICAEAQEPSDQEFMSGLYEEYKKLMFSTAGKYTSNYHDREDIVQDSIAKLLKVISKLRRMKRCTLVCYIVLTVRNTAINHLKKQSVIRKHFISLDTDLMDDDKRLGPPELSLEDLVLLSEKNVGLRQVWDQLSETDRILLEGKYILEYSDATLAQQLGCKASSIRMKLTRARRRALALMEKQEGDDTDGQTRKTQGSV